MIELARRLIVNADDFGISHGVNRGIIEAHTDGIVTSASLMVRRGPAEEAAAMAGQHPGLGLGLHLDLGEWIYRDGRWEARYEVVGTDDANAVEAEIERQVDRFIELCQGPPDHLDSHQHVHLTEPVMALVDRIAARLGVPVRRRHPEVAYQSLYGQDRDGTPLHQNIAPPAYVRAIAELGPGITEFGCHPGYAADLDSDYCLERQVELESLRDPGVRAALEVHGVELVTWGVAGAG